MTLSQRTMTVRDGALLLGIAVPTLHRLMKEGKVASMVQPMGHRLPYRAAVLARAKAKRDGRLPVNGWTR